GTACCAGLLATAQASMERPTHELISLHPVPLCEPDDVEEQVHVSSGKHADNGYPHSVVIAPLNFEEMLECRYDTTYWYRDKSRRAHQPSPRTPDPSAGMLPCS